MRREEIDLEQFREFFTSDDPMSVLLKGHLFLEAQLVDLIETKFDERGSNEWLFRLPFPTKIELAKSLGVLPWPEALRVYNGVRNDLAHKPHFKVDQSTIERIYKSFEPDFGSYFEEPCPPPALDKSLPLTEQLVSAIMAIALCLAVTAADEMKAKIRRTQEQTRRLRRLLRKHEAKRGSRPETGEAGDL